MSKGTDKSGRTWENLKWAYDTALNAWLTNRSTETNFLFIKAKKNLEDCEAYIAQQEEKQQ